MNPLRIGVFVAVLAFPSLVSASLITSDPSLPPAGQYRSPAQVHADYLLGGGNILTLANIVHFGFTGIVRIPVGADERESFGSTVTGDILLNNVPLGSIVLAGPVETLVHNKIGNTTGTFDTEMLALSLAGITPLGPVLVRESPTLQSTGKTTITDQGGGLFKIDSFFDVFTELSLDGGQTFIPSTGSTRVELTPEPASLVLMALGLAALGARRARARPTRRT